MPLDHYISQVHLKNFYSSNLDGLMYAIRKTDQKVFTPNAKSVCRIQDGNTNPYLEKSRVIEEFLKIIEPNYNKAVQKISCGKIDKDSILVIAGFISYISTCSPAAIRIHTPHFETALTETACSLEYQKLLPEPPKELGSTLSELIESGKIVWDIDPKYPQSIGIELFTDFIKLLGNSKWEILINHDVRSPFFSSDFPIALEVGRYRRPPNKIVPLTPNIAVRIIPDPMIDTKNMDFSFPNFGFRIKRPSQQQVKKLNQLIVQCAEELVFSNHNAKWVRRFVLRNSGYRVETQTHDLPMSDGKLILYSVGIVETDHGVGSS